MPAILSFRTSVECDDVGGKTGVCGRNCSHYPHCPAPGDSDASAAAIVADHCEQGWYRLCNGLILFDDGLVLLGAESAA